MSNKIKVFIVSPQRTMSGGEICLYRVFFDNDYFDPTLASPNGTFTDFLRSKEINFLPVDEMIKSNRSSNKFWIFDYIKKYIIANLKLYALIKKGDYQVVFGNGRLGLIYAIFTALLLRKKLIWTHYDYLSNFFDNTIVSIASIFATRTITVSEPIKKRISNLFNKNKTITIHNGLNLEDVSIVPKNLSKTIKVGIVGKILPWKGHIVLIEALRLLHRNNIKNFELIVIGDTDTQEGKNYLKQIEQKINKYILKKHVSFTGSLSNINEIYNKIDICINASISPEPLGTTIYESMAFGKIILASNLGGSPEIIKNGIDGFLFKPNDSFDLSEKLAHIITHFETEEMNQIKVNAVKRVKENFNNKETRKKYYNLFNKAIK
ncbi:glycosyltransferase family 4 protein [Reichenbachiella carrageenanivorans]|uniref:Glycosyltransferase family 4 protein n=1 Tax=Reichenbachiella carrageenanivorans TaxID=2979869 RepID=A0ABY6D371_9BACT|nr:glycosyltransferase family 4 protein [Reichenbachiella carrageenanivorans]UXX80597.1 glycosyltransferase family 4 protein [Reichenbachiella carrageenanivorans]